MNLHLSLYFFQIIFNGLYLVFLTLTPLVLLPIKDLPIIELLKKEKNKKGVSRYDEFRKQIKRAKLITEFFLVPALIGFLVIMFCEIFPTIVLDFGFVEPVKVIFNYEKNGLILIPILSNLFLNSFTFYKINHTLDFLVHNIDRGKRA